jgi:Fic family protein
MCDYVNENWSKSPVHLAAYVLWRMNWIHPFVDGNGRTARALSYLVLSVRLGYRLPGTNTIPDQIASDKNPYYRALEDADKAFSVGQVDVSKAEALVEVLLANQLASVLRAAKSSAISKERDQAV